VKALVVIAVVLAPGIAAAYPQFQLSKDQTCTSCHISPAGGLLLNENGLMTADTLSTFHQPPEAAHGALVGPSWLQVSADLRGGSGLIYDVGMHPNAFPMQGDGDIGIHGHGFTFVGMLGLQQGHDVSTVPVSREHWVMWQPDEGASDGLYVRAGRFMPVYGLRFAEHTAYTRRYGGTPLYGEAYGAAVEYVKSAYEVHVTGFVHDPIQYSAEPGNGAAAYGEVRLSTKASVGAEGRYAKSDQDRRLQGGLTAKLWLDPILLEAEGQVIDQRLVAGGPRTQLVSYLFGSWFVRDGWMVDVGVGQYNEDTHVKNVDIECIDTDVHWFASSHWELLETNRIQTIALGSGGSTSGYALMQFHYRL
jgi:hypothetical protein